MILLIDQPKCGIDWLSQELTPLNQGLVFINQHFDNSKIVAIYSELSTKLDRAYLEQFPNLEVIATPTTSLTQLDLDFCMNESIKVISLKDFQKEISDFSATIEIAVWHLLELFRRVSSSVSSVRFGNWDRNEFVGVTLAHKSIGILGFGRLGRKMAKVCEAMGMRVFIYDIKQISKGILSDSYTLVDSIAELFSLCDAVSIHVDDRSTNRRLIDANVLASISSKGLMLINTSRGFVVDEEAVLFYLKEGRLKGYGTDVLTGEEILNKELDWLSASNMFKALLNEGLNISLTPHIGGATIETMTTSSRLVLESLISKIKSIS